MAGAANRPAPRIAAGQKAAEYLDTDPAVGAFFDRTGKPERVALDTEGASFHRFVDRIYLIQISTPRDHAIIDPLPVAAPSQLGAWIQDPSVEVVFHDADYDLRLFAQDYGWKARNVFDTRVAAQLLGVNAFGLAALLESHFGVKLNKKHQRADWSMRPLTDDMLDYAAQDTMHLLALRDRMADALRKKERWSWAREEFDRLEGIRWSDEDAAFAFLRIKGARDLTRRELAVFRELVQWRDSVAKEIDKATFRVVGNEVLLEASKAPPADRAALLRIKGMPRGIGERRGGEMLDAIRRGLAVPESELPRFPKAKRWARDPDFDAKVAAIKSVRDAAAKRLELDPGVLCSRDRMEAVARLLPRAVEELSAVEGLRRWQIAELGSGFVKALRGYKPVGQGGEKDAASDDSPYLSQ
ncbi:MAG: ribonuclease D [Gemmatimonadetes bacterium]|nr:ribonuclease D [Gemmatimonadota bacterium]